MTVQERIDHDMIMTNFKKGWREASVRELGEDYDFAAKYVKKINWWHDNNRVAILKSTIEDKVYHLRMFSDDNEYSIRITPTYIGGGMSCRYREPLEDWHRGHDLPDGKCVAETMEKIIYAILHDELIPYDDGYHKPYQAEEDVEEDKSVSNGIDVRSYKVGDKIKPKRSRKEYTIVAVFEDNDKEFYVAKTNGNQYSQIFCYDEEGNLYQHT